MKIVAQTFNKASAAFFICTVLIYVSVIWGCPVADDARANSCRLTYKSLADGNITRTLDIFAGKLIPAHCIAHCGCLGKAYAGLDHHGHCFCGAEQGEVCNSAPECLRVYSTTGIPSSPSGTFPSKLELFTSQTATISGLTNVIRIAVENYGKLTYFTPSTGNIAFVQVGEQKASIEVEGYFGCRTPDYTVNVFSPLKIDLFCPMAVRPSEEFFCSAKFYEGSGIQAIEWKKDGERLVSITNVGEPLIYATGGNLTIDRFESFNTSFDYSKGETVTYINLNYEFTAVGRVKAFEAHFLRPGEVRFQIFKPMCDQAQTEKIYCNSQKKCVISGCGTPSNQLGVLEFYPPASKPVFCPDVERFKPDDNDTCPQPPTITFPGADYKLVDEYIVNVTQNGNTVVKVPEDKNITVYPGYVLGWTTGRNNKSADIGAYSYENAYEQLYPEYLYKEAYEIHIGSVFSRKLPTAELFPKYHLLRAHTISPTNYLKKLSLPNAGQPYVVGVVVTSSETSVPKSLTIQVQYDITGYTLSASPLQVYINTDVTFTVSSINTDLGVSYCFHFGEERSFNGSCDSKVSTKTIKKQFAVPGIYTVTCRAENLLNYLDRNITIEVFANIDKISFVKAIDPEPTGDISTSLFNISGKGNATVLYDLGDNTMVRVLNVTLTEFFVAEVQYKYAKQGDYLFHVTAKNPLESKEIYQYASVEDSVTTCVINPPGVAATNVSHLFSIASHVGTNTTYVWNWTDGTPNSTSPVNDREMRHTYTTYGNRTLSVYAFNKISNFTCSVFIEVQDIIKGLNFSQQAGSVYAITPTNQSQPTQAWFTIEQGTGMDIKVVWDEKYPTSRVSTKAYDRDRQNTVNGRFIGRAIYQYSTIDTYNVTVYAENAVSNMSVTSKAIYEIPVAVGTHKMEQKDDPASYIEVNETVCFTMQPSAGTNFVVWYDFNDTTSTPITTPNTTLCRSWPYWQLPFYTKFDMYNNVSSLKKEIQVFVQMPVHNFTTFAITGGPENTTEEMELVLHEATGDFFHCLWTIKDTTTVEKNLTYVDFQNKKHIKHRFATPGIYDVSVVCTNRLYQATAKINVTSYIPASDFEVQVVYGGACGSKKAAGDKGDGPDSDMYAYGCPLKFVVSAQLGSNITYQYDFGEEGKGTTTKLLEVLKTFEQSSEDSRVIKISASNPTSSFVKNVKLKFLPRITGLTIENDGPVKMGKKVTYTVKVIQKGLGSCFLVDCESAKDENKKITSSQFWMGEDSCRYQTKYKAIDSKPDLDPGKGASWEHIFQHTGMFRCTVTGENSVSSEVAFTDVTVLDKPCNKPTVVWRDISLNISKPFNITKSKSTMVAVKLTKDCEKTDEVEYNWNISRIDAKDGKKTPLKSIPHTKTDTALSIPARALEYGLHQIDLLLCMKDVDPTVCTPVTGFIYVNPSNLYAGFEGGSGRAGGQNKILDINAKPTHDPDAGETIEGLKLRWYCKLQSEKFPSDYSTMPELKYPEAGPAPEALNSSLPLSNNFTGCFGNGIGYLKQFDDKSLLQINSSFMPLRQYYTLRLHVSKLNSPVPRANTTADYTVYIVPGDPPEIKIKCIVNCQDKVNADKSFKLQAVCAKYCNGKINYKWSMQKKLIDETDDKYVSMSEKDLKENWFDTPIDNKNLAMKENMLDAKYSYRVRLTGTLDQFDEVFGFSLYTIVVNIAPKAPTSEHVYQVTPPTGKPLAKVFKGIISGFTDTDLPLTFLIDYRATGTDKEEDWTNLHNSLSQFTDLIMLPEGPKSNGYKIEFRFYVEDVYRARSEYRYKTVVVKGEDQADLSSVLAASKGSTDPEQAGRVAMAVLSTEGSSAVASNVVEMMGGTDVTSDAGALALASTMGKCMDTGALSDEAKAKAMQAMTKCAKQMGPDTPAEVVTAVATNVFGVLLTGTEDSGDSGSGEDTDETITNLGTTVAGNMVAGEKPFQKATGRSLISCQAMEPGSGGAVDLGSGGGFDMDTSLLGEEGTQLQAVGGNGPNKYKSENSTGTEVTSDVVSLDIASSGKTTEVKNLTKPIVVKIKQPVNPNLPARHTAYTHILKTVHLVSNPSDNQSSIFIEIKNETELIDSGFFVIVKKGLKPKLYDNDFNFTLPHVVNESKPDGQNKSAEELKIEYKNRFRIFLNGQTDLNNTSIGTYYVAVLNCPLNMTNVTLPLSTSESDPGPYNLTIPPKNYTFASFTGVCKFFNKTSKKWSTNGLKISQASDQNFTVCSTTHLSSFAGGSVFAKPNTIDFSKAFAGFSNIGENPTVFATTLSIIGIYFLLLAYCRYKDKKDIEKIGVFPLEDNHPSDNYLYEVAVQTGFVKGAGTTADVFIILNGSLGETSPRKLNNPNRKCFNKGDTDSFLLSTPFSLGLIKDIEVWHNNAGNSPGWYCMQVQIRDVQSEKKFIFVCNRWLAVEEDDGLIKRKVDIATKDDLTQFDFLFAQTARKNLYDGHIWFSIFTRPPRSHFTRCQRLGCCLTLLLTSMLANAMFYKDPAPATATDDPNAPKAQATDSIHLGPITISVEQIKIGFTSSLVVIPVNLIIATLFQKAKPREEKKKEKANKYAADGDEDEESSIGSARNLVSTSKIDLVERGSRPSVGNTDAESEPEMTEEEREIEKSKKRANFLKMLCMPGNEEDEEGDESKKKKAKPKAMLPHWVIYIAYVLIFLASGTAAFFVILYGFQFGKEKSDNWMKSMMLSFWQSVLVIQPVKVLALSVLFAMIIKDPKAASGDEEGGSKGLGKDEKAQEGKKKKKKVGENGEEEEEEDSESENEDDAEKEREKNLEFKLPDEKKLEEARQLRLKEKKMKAIIREIVIHLLFVMLCLFIGYSNMDPFAQRFGKGVRNFLGEDLQGVTRVEQYWDWVENKFIPYLYPGKWYNGYPYEHQMVADTEPSRIISMARMRQLRVKKNTCTKHPIFENIILECNGAYSWGNEDTKSYSAHWKPPLNKTETRKLRHRKRKALWLGLENPWQHQSVLKLKNFPFLGKFATYSGSSYAVSIGPDERISRLIIKDMKDNFWIDRYTRAVFVEFNIYNANTNLMMIVTLLSEVLQTGGWNYFDNVQAIRLYRWQGGIGGIIVFADLIFMVVTLVGVYKLVKKCKKEGVKNYLKSAWNFLHAFVTVFSICTFACVFARVGAVMWAMKQFKNDPEVFVSFAYLGQLDYFVQAFIGFVVMATNLEFLRLLRFNKKIGLLTGTIRQSMKPLASFGFIFLFIFMSYVSLAHLLFVDQLEDYKNFGTSVVSLTRMFLGQFDVYAYMAAAPLLGPLLFLSYMIAIQMVLINMFIGIICETFEEVRLDIAKQSNDHEIVSFMTNRFKKIAGAAVGPSVDPIYREWKSDWELTLESIEEKSDSIVYLLRNVEAEEVRQNQWMEPTKANEKKRNLLKLLIGSDEFTYENEILDTLQLLDKRMKKLTVDKSRKMVYTMAKKKKKDREEEMKSRTEEQSIFSEEESEDEDDREENEENSDDNQE